MGHGYRAGNGESGSRTARGSECVIVRSGTGYDGKQGMNLSTGISHTSAGSKALCMHLVVIPPGTRGTPHMHDGHETAIYIAQGEVEVWYGSGLASRVDLAVGDFMYIPPGTAHLPVNRGGETALAVVARTDPAEQESVVVLDLPSHLADLTGLPVAAEG